MRLKQFIIFLLIVVPEVLLAQKERVSLKQNQLLVIADSIFIAETDTVLMLPPDTKYRFINDKHRSRDFYSKIYKKAKKRRFTRELYKLLVSERPQNESHIESEPLKSEIFFEPFKGRKIRKINVHPVGILSGDVDDTTKLATSTLSALSNRWHINTHKQIILNNLLFKVGQEVDPFDMSDSERIIRSLPYIEDIRIKLSLNADETVDALIIYKDRFPWNINLSIYSHTAFLFGFKSRNILGSGNEFSINYLHSLDKELPKHGYALSFTKRNIKHTFIDATIYSSDSYLGRSLGISFKRDFISPQIKYYGGVTVERVQPIENLFFADSLYGENFRSDRLSFDAWAGRGFKVGKRSSINFGTRLQRDNFFERPIVKKDSNEFFHDHYLLLGALSYNRISFLKTKNILAFNITEEIPEGFLFSILYGRDWNEFDTQTYRGASMNYANYTQFGYFNFNVEAGFFKNEGVRKNEIIEISTRYFSPLFGVGNSHSRFYSRIYFFDGNKLSIPQSQTLSDINRLHKISGDGVRGDRVLSFTTDYVVFQPWYWYGFRFAPYGHGGVGYVREARIEQPYDRVYTSLGVGIRIRNESLVYGTYDFRMSLFPNPPPNGNIFNFKLLLSAPSLFAAPSFRKPKIVGSNF